MYEKVNSNPDIYNIFVPLPNNPLKNLNCYVLKTPEKSLVIDTGFNREECKEALLGGLKELGIEQDNIELFITHLHSDHCGLVNKVAGPNTTIYMGRIDYEYMLEYADGDPWKKEEETYLREGFPPDAIEELRTTNPARAYALDKLFKAVCMDDGDEIKIVGDYTLKCILTSGHTPGHMCLYMEKEKIMFLGDHVLFDITPNITFWTRSRNSLLDYLNSLEKIKKYDVKLALPAHRTNNGINFYERIEQIEKHHDFRLNQCMELISKNPGINAYDLAGKMRWKMRGKSWVDFPMPQKWFAVGETIAHTDYLFEKGLIDKKMVNGINRYEIK
ncbi:MAG: MBL fold metallo-hydrolase [Clostridia bacterium]|jgi:glyoxylase-like metal-dependent hydrolase (beta-lactamase superfamily II)|nr:MBL fold metallo-hydrolase [Clostridia bacterium]MCI1999840.1 MBL fold metallo-hydrolase [Clostridia bacterium]MCI2014244.1 MBL fold metallo-hydrolase [Clostridia bacterium]